MDRTYSRINWQNLPSKATPISAQNLNKGDYAIDVLDQRVISLDTTKANKSDLSPLIRSITYNPVNGVFTITKYDNSSTTIDTPLEKMVVNFAYDAENQKLVITNSDGTKSEVSLSAFITEAEFNDSERIAFNVERHNVSADIKKNSITDEYLEPNYLAHITEQAEHAEQSAEQAADSEDASDYNAKLSQSYAIGNSGIRENEDTDNAKYYCEQAYLSDYSIMSKSWAVGNTGRREGEDTDNSHYYSELAKRYTITHIDATVDDNIGIPSVDVTQTSQVSDPNKTYRFDFKNLKGEKGEKGDKGIAVNDAYINDYHHLILIYDDGSEIDSGEVGANVIPLTTEEYKALPIEIRDDEGLYFWITDCDGNTASIIVAGTTNFNRLQNKPQINGITLEGNKSAEELGLVSNLRINGFTLNNDTHSIEDLDVPGVIQEKGKIVKISDNDDDTIAIEEGAEVFNDYSELEYLPLGDKSLSAGNIAAGKYSHAEGHVSMALGDFSHSENSSTAVGRHSHSEGITHYLSNLDKVADTTGKLPDVFYYDKGAYGDESHSEGFRCNAVGRASHAEGFGTYAQNTGAHAEGDNTLAYGYYSHAEGRGLDIHATITEDNLSGALGDASHTEGIFALATGTGAHAEGNSTKSIGSAAHAEGHKTIADGINSHAEGFKTNAEQTNSHAEGNATTASGAEAHAEGLQTIASGHESHAEGIGSTASGNNSHAEGGHTHAVGYYSHVEGNYTKAYGGASHAEGNYTVAGKIDSSGTVIDGVNAHAEGDHTQAEGLSSHAEGTGSIASAQNSHAGGYYTIAGNVHQTVIGRLNDNKQNTLFEVGNGNTSNNTRHNAFEVFEDGHINVNGDYYQNGVKLDFGGGSSGGTSVRVLSFEAFDFQQTNLRAGYSRHKRFPFTIPRGYIITGVFGYFSSDLSISDNEAGTLANEYGNMSFKYHIRFKDTPISALTNPVSEDCVAYLDAYCYMPLICWGQNSYGWYVPENWPNYVPYVPGAFNYGKYMVQVSMIKVGE